MYSGSSGSHQRRKDATQHCASSMPEPQCQTNNLSPSLSYPRWKEYQKCGLLCSGRDLQRSDLPSLTNIHTASVQRATKAGSPASLCYTLAYFMRCVYDFIQVNIIHRNIANSFMSKQSTISLFPASCWPDLTSSPHAINSHAEL
jgi:hypothetical protein